MSRLRLCYIAICDPSLAIVQQCTFDKLSNLIITDQLKRKTPFEFNEYYLDEWANMNSPVQLAEKLEEFEDFKRTLSQKSSKPFVKKPEFKSPE
ncbi:hypothetical protein TNCV_3969401 [Trichonephila clavipes]|nr:hypothetical protein TNCV_3969401 [Trichonephila clavipes]